MKILRNVFRILAGLVLSVYLVVLILLNFSPATQWMTQRIEATLEDVLQTELSIGNMEVSLFDRVILHDVKLYDQKRQQMLSAGMMSVKVDLPALFNNRVAFRTISILDADIDLYKENEGTKPNFQFIVDAFASKDKKEKSKLDLAVNSLVIRRTHVKFNQHDRAKTPGVVNLSHISVRDIDASISLKRLTSDSVQLRVRNLDFHEESGLDVQKLQLNLAAGRKNMSIEDFDLRLPNSVIKFDDLTATYSGNNIKEYIKTLKLKGDFDNVTIATDDLACLHRKMQGLHQTFDLSLAYNVTPQQIQLQNLILSNREKTISLNADVLLKRNDNKCSGVSGDVENLLLQKGGIQTIKTVLGDLFPQSKWLNLHCWNTVEHISANGIAQYSADGENFVKAKVETNLGVLDSNLSWKDKKLVGDLSVEHLELGHILGNEKLPTDISALISGTYSWGKKGLPMAEAKVGVEQVLFNDYLYKDVDINGMIQGNRYLTTIVSNDPALNLEGNLEGLLVSSQICDVQANLKIRSVSPKSLNLTNYFGESHFSANLDMNTSSFDLYKLQGRVAIKDFQMVGEKVGHVESFVVETHPTARGRYVDLKSDFADLEFDGPISKHSLLNLKDRVMSYVFPEKQINSNGTEEWIVRARVKDTQILNTICQIPLSFGGEASLEGRLGGHNDGAYLSIFTDRVTFGNTSIDHPRLYLRGENGAYNALLQCGKKIKNTNVKFELNAQTSKDRLVTEILWDDASLHKFYGSLGLVSSKNETGDIVTDLQPTELMINDSLWVVVPGSVTIKGKDVSINNLGIARQGQSLSVNGNLTKNPNDALVADLERIDVNYILNIFNVKPVKISGNATGQIKLLNAFDSLRVVAKGLDVPNFAFNDAPLGHARIDGGFSVKDKKIRLNAKINEEGVGYTNVDGYISPAEKSLDLRINNKNTNIAFLDKYVSTIFEGVRGHVTGNCRIYGNFSTIDFQGSERGDVSTKIIATGATYHLRDGVVQMSKGCFDFSDFSVVDDYSGRGTLKGQLRHKHLKDLSYDFKVDAENLLFYNQPRSLDMPFYATAGGTGDVRIKGEPGELSVDAKIRPHDLTQFYYMVDSPGGIGDVEFLRIRDANISKNNIGDTIDVNLIDANDVQARARTTDIMLDFTIDMNPMAKLFVIMDQQSGDRIQLGGTGTITAKYYNKGDFQMLGNFVVQNGNYKLSLQDVIRKEFTFEPGGTINFTGDPLESALDLRAKYLVPSVSLSDLNIGTKLSESSVPVNCVLLLSGTAGHPLISFDLDMPRVSDDINRMVRNLINTEEDMNMQVLYLLGVGRFYTYNYASTEAAETQSQSTVAVKSFLSNALTGQLNNIIANAMGTTNWTFGTNLSTGTMGWSDIEVEGLLSGRLLNNRLLINGNFGYRDRPQFGTTNFVGDFDVQYILTQGGGVSIKVYSETNDRYFSKSTLTTQGAGIQLKRQFSNLRDLFAIRKRKRIKVFEEDSVSISQHDSTIMDSIVFE